MNATTAKPGSWEKIEVLRKRAELGIDLFIQGDEIQLASLEDHEAMIRRSLKAARERKEARKEEKPKQYDAKIQAIEKRIRAAIVAGKPEWFVRQIRRELMRIGEN